MSIDLPVYVIALPDSDRVVQLERLLTINGVQWKRMEAVDARQLTPDQLEALADVYAGKLLYGSPLSATQVGCSLSHLNAYSCLLEQGANWAIVFEDDAYLLQGSVALIGSLATWKAKAPTVVEFYSEGRVIETLERKVLHGQLTLQRLATYPGFAVAYAINREAAELALAYRGRVASRADWPSWATEVEFWRTRPNLVLHGAPGEAPHSTMFPFNTTEPLRARVLRWAGLLSGVTYIRLRSHYPGGFRQFLRHAVLPSALFWKNRAKSALNPRRSRPNRSSSPDAERPGCP